MLLPPLLRSGQACLTYIHEQIYQAVGFFIPVKAVQPEKACMDALTCFSDLKLFPEDLRTGAIYEIPKLA